MSKRRDPPIWFSAGFFGALCLGALVPHTSQADEYAIQIGGFLTGAWWGFLEGDGT